MAVTADSPRDQRFKVDSHTEQVTGCSLGDKLIVWVGREAIEGTLYYVPAVNDGTPVTIHVVVVGKGRTVIPWAAITKIEPLNDRV